MIGVNRVRHPRALRALARFDRPRDTASGFTLPELMIVLGVLIIIMSILLPSFNKMREAARAVQCASNLHQVSSAFLLFAAEHDRRLPGGLWDADDPDAEHHDWLFGTPNVMSTAPEGGTLFKYLSGNQAVYRCPSLDYMAPRPGSFFGPYHGSNGKFDYKALVAFAGAGLWNVKGTSRMLSRDEQTYEVHPTPLIVEVEPIWINGFRMNGAFADKETMAHHHRGGSQYATITGSVEWINEPDWAGNPQGCLRWESEAPSGEWVSLGTFPEHWGGWDRR